MKRRIEITKEAREMLLKKYGCTNNTITNALNYYSDSYQARCIREDAMRLGGKVWSCSAPEAEEERSSSGATAEHPCLGADCVVRQWLPCSKGITCCQCDDAHCNSRQTCPAGRPTPVNHD